MKKRKKKHSRRNPSSHPFWAGLLAFLGTGIFGRIVFALLRGKTPAAPWIAAASGGAATAGLGAYIFPQSRTPIIVGALIGAVVDGASSAFLDATASDRPFVVGERVIVSYTDATGGPATQSGEITAIGTGSAGIDVILDDATHVNVSASQLKHALTLTTTP
jgi:hypothetical protein